MSTPLHLTGDDANLAYTLLSRYDEAFTVDAPDAARLLLKQRIYAGIGQDPTARFHEWRQAARTAIRAGQPLGPEGKAALYLVIEMEEAFGSDLSLAPALAALRAKLDATAPPQITD